MFVPGPVIPGDSMVNAWKPNRLTEPGALRPPP